MVRSITASRIHERCCNSHNNPDIKGGNTLGQNISEAGLAFWSAEYTCFDPILDMDEVLEFISPSHSEIEWLDRQQEWKGIDNTDAQLVLTIN